MVKQDARSDATAALDHLTSAGVEARLLDGDRCVLATMRLQPIPFETLTGSMRVDQVIFSSVGRYRIKCLKPHALFNLPLIRIHDCRDTTALEARIRLTWKRYIATLTEGREWLDALGTKCESSDDGSLLAFPLEGENQHARVQVLEPRSVVLPGLGRLSGIKLSRPEDRSLYIDRGVRSSVELEIAVSARLDELLHLDRRLSDQNRRAAITEIVPEPRSAPATHPIRILLVGPRLSREQSCIDSMRLRGYRVDTATSEQEGIATFDRYSPELVLADMHLGRNEGTSLVLALRQVTGIEEIPVVLIDESRRESSREAARHVGAAGYMVYPIEIPRIAGQLEQITHQPRRRRYTRYGRKLPVGFGGNRDQCITTSLGRGGMFVATDTSLEEKTLHECRIGLPEFDASVHCEAEVLYRRGNLGRSRGGYGVRFNSFEESDENLLIEYLRTIDQSTASANVG